MLKVKKQQQKNLAGF